MKRMFTTLAFLVAADQAIKLWVRDFMAPGGHVLIPQFLELTHQENRGISFSLLSDLPDHLRVPLLSGISALVVLVILVHLVRQRLKLPRLERWGLVLVVAGAIGNLIDRAWRQSVTDYMHFRFYETSFFVNNLADDLISLGFVLLLWQALFKKDQSA